MSPFATAPGTRAKASQIESRLPSSAAAPSICAAEVAAPHRKSAGQVNPTGSVGGAHPFTAPVMMPEISWRPAATNSTSSGMVASTAPASTTG